jgi:hypothetical protein
MSKKMRLAERVARMGEKETAYKLLAGKPDGKRLLGRPRLVWMDSIKMDLETIEYGGVDWDDLAQDKEKWKAVVNAVIGFPVAQNARKLSSGHAAGGLSSSPRLHRVTQLYHSNLMTYLYWFLLLDLKRRGRNCSWVSSKHHICIPATCCTSALCPMCSMTTLACLLKSPRRRRMPLGDKVLNNYSFLCTQNTSMNPRSNGWQKNQLHFY